MKDYIGKRCWQARGYTTVLFGNVIDQKMEDKWLMLQIKWDHSPITTWETVVNVSFQEINSWKLTS